MPKKLGFTIVALLVIGSVVFFTASRLSRTVRKTRVQITERGIPLLISVFASTGWEQQFDKFEDVIR